MIPGIADFSAAPLGAASIASGRMAGPAADAASAAAPGAVAAHAAGDGIRFAGAHREASGLLTASSVRQTLDAATRTALTQAQMSAVAGLRAQQKLVKAMLDLVKAAV